MATVADFIREWQSSDEYVTAHTSGSTGEPKPIRLLKEDMRTSAGATNRFFGIGRDSVVSMALSPDYIAGKMMIVRALEAGCELLPLEVSNTVAVPRHVDLLALVPSQVPSLLSDESSCRRVGALLLGGAAVPGSLAAEICRAGIPCYVGYGMTETCSHVALRDLTAGAECYRAMPGITFEVDARGCLVVCSEKFSWRRLVTNDIVDISDPQTFRWLGRADKVIVSGGLKIHPELLEDEIRSLFPSLPPFYITSRPDDRWGNAVVMVIAGAADPGLRDRIASALSDRRRAPKELIFVEKLPMTQHGNKIARLTPAELSRIC